MFSLPRKCRQWAALSLLLLSACQTVTVTPVTTDPEPQAIVYTIKKGEHSSDSPFVVRSVTTLKFEATFDASATYKTTTDANQGDINKLYGIADCRTDHHSNSARFGWRWYNNQLEIHAYTYLNKVRQSKMVGVVDLNKAYTYEIQVQDNKYVFTLNGNAVELPRHCNGKAEGYQLYPYFGGDEVAPHDITIAIRELEI
ncbi:hypothetical protein H8S95_05285 [Pontibacter sp. KCTC 32443]|uniref:hypothetical protein n=1 Tax=Pontibacter TaxID=323449 RepID=UPI00164E3DC8|nr:MULTISPECIES: hypothetical protein [Pontibacter]MBC5773469.1 hypothetical protein [Pontibacter sp. KCTC 32443]